jgi:hypothetical protein
LALSVLWNNESLLDQCLKAGADPRAATVTSKKITVMQLAKQNGLSKLFKKLEGQIVQSWDGDDDVDDDDDDDVLVHAPVPTPTDLQDVSDSLKSLRVNLEKAGQVFPEVILVN